MADATTVVEGKIKFREGKKWKPRWCILKKPSPVADQLQVVLYKDVNQAVKDEAKPKNVFVLEAFFGLDAGITFDREPHVLAVICQKTIILMAFEQREHMIQFEIKIRQSLGEEHQFPVTVVKAPSSSRLLKEQVRLVIHDLRFCLIAQTPPKILLSWNIEDLRRFGTNENKFCFEGGSRCGKGTGVFALQSEQAKDIEDIVHLASLGKMSNGHRKSKIRSSQVDLSTHLIADMLPSHSSSYIHHHHQNSGSKSPPQAPLPATLNCCYDNQTGSAESEDWSWYKRHSVSVMDHHRIVASRDNKDHFMGIYDVPPNHGRKLADSIDGREESNYAVPRTYLENAPSESTHNSNNDYTNYDHKRSNDSNPEDQNIFKSVDGFTLQVNEMASKSPSPSASREESLQRLKMQESDLQREMVLLDEILQNCAAKNHEKSFESNKNDQSCSEGNPSKSYKSPLTSLDGHLTIISGNVSPFSIKLENPHAPKRMDRVMAERLNTSMPEPMPVSPLCKRKQKNILAPLPYVNLSRYDDESYSHVHLPGSSDSIPLVRDSNPMGLDVKQVRLRGQSSSLINLTQASAQQVPSKPYYVGASTSSMVPYEGQQSSPGSKHTDHQEILFVNLDDSNVSDPVVYASLQCMVPDENTNPNNDLVKVLMSDAGRHLREEIYINCEAIYENLPFKTDNTLPPELPPKGPALLKKLQAASSNRQMTNPINAQSPIQCVYRPNDISSLHPAPERNYNGYDSHLHSSSYDTEQNKKLDLKEDNYCMMGSPKVQHKLSVIPESPFKSSKVHNLQSQFKSSDIHVRSDYMDMGVLGSEGFEDEIYLDVDVTKNVSAKDLYISEADLRLTSNISGESTYMDMSCVPNRKSIVVPNVDTTYVSRTPVKETSRQNQRTKLGPAPPPPCPPRPLSFKKTQNVDKTQKSNHMGETNANQEPKSSQNIKPVKSTTKVYTKAKKCNQSEAPMPFPNLIDFTKKLSESRSTYVNTFIDSDKHCAGQGDSYILNRDVQLPEPAKEGFLARFKRRSSKDKNAFQTPEKSNKNRNSVLERSMSEHETSKAVKDEKTSKLKLGRRRSSSFPNRLSYQEALDSVAGLSQAVGSCSSFVSGSSKPNSTCHQAEPCESSSSIQDISDDSDMSPLLKRGDKKQDSHALTVLHVHQGSTNPLYPYMQISKSVTTQGGSSKTDDEKLIEMIQQKNSLKKTVVYQRSSSLELKSPVKDTDQTYYLKISKPTAQTERRLSFERLMGCTNVIHSSGPEANEDPSKPLDKATLGDEHLPPALPPKLKSYQVPLSPVLEALPPIPASTEPLYVELDEVVVASETGEDVEKKENRHQDREKEMR